MFNLLNSSWFIYRKTQNYWRLPVSKVRGVRFSESEEKQVEEFLLNNPFLDFSTLARIAITEFIKKPMLSLVPVREIERIRKGEKDVRSN
jgi:hypothetical protein